MSGRSSDVVRVKRDNYLKPNATKRAWPDTLSRIVLSAGCVGAAAFCILTFAEGVEPRTAWYAAASAVLLLAGAAGLWHLKRTAAPRAYRSLHGELMREITVDLVVRLDVAANRAEVSEPMAREFEFPLGPFENALERLSDQVHIGDRRRFVRSMAEYLGGDGSGRYIDEVRMLNCKGKARSLLVRGKLEQEENGRGAWFVAIAEDVTDLRKRRVGPKPKGNLDDLTGLPNRRCFEDDLAFDLLGGRRCGLLLAGLDGFKHINNAYGYDVGDMLLKSVAGRLSAVIDGWGLAYRYGGDVFAVIFPDGRDDAQRVKAVVGEVFRRAWNVRGQEVYLSASIGSASAPHDGHGAQEVLHAAEDELFQAKQYGKNCHILYNTLHNSPAGKRRMAIENGMRRSIENGFEGFEIRYQPVISFESGRVAGAEALLRFAVEGIGEVEPAEFIPLAECAGLIIPLGRWVLEKACVQCRAWHQSGYVNLYVSVNVSPMQMLGGDMVGLVQRAIAESGLPADRLVLEITENMFIQDMDKVVPQLSSLRDLGIRISLDDFGKGFSSLTHLKDIPLDEVKIDRDFIHGLGKQAYYETFIRTIITLAHTIDLRVTSEGIETFAQRKKVAELGSDNGQGYFVSPALAPERLLALL